MKIRPTERIFEGRPQGILKDFFIPSNIFLGLDHHSLLPSGHLFIETSFSVLYNLLLAVESNPVRSSSPTTE